MNNSSHSLVAAFTGHRTYKRSGDDRLRATIEQLYDEGVRLFRVGMAEGFDLAAGDILLTIREEHPSLRIEAIVPYPQFAERFNICDRQLYKAIISKADIVRYADEEYHYGVYHKRNDMLVEGADVVVAWWNGRPSGTEYTIGQARRIGCRIINIYFDSQLEIDF